MPCFTLDLLLNRMGELKSGLKLTIRKPRPKYLFLISLCLFFCSFPKDKLILSDGHDVMLRAEQEAALCLSEWVYS